MTLHTTMDSQGLGSLEPVLGTADGEPAEDIYGASDVQRMKQVLLRAVHLFLTLDSLVLSVLGPNRRTSTKRRALSSWSSRPILWTESPRRYTTRWVLLSSGASAQ